MMKNWTPSDKCRFSQSVGTIGNLRIVPPSGAVYYQALSDVGWREGSNLSTEWSGDGPTGGSNGCLIWRPNMSG
jgi:hypothetical protein